MLGQASIDRLENLRRVFVTFFQHPRSFGLGPNQYSEYAALGALPPTSRSKPRARLALSISIVLADCRSETFLLTADTLKPSPKSKQAV